MTAQGSDLEYRARVSLDRNTQRLDLPGADVANLSITELESLLAERRRRESKRMLRTIAGRPPARPASQIPAAPPRRNKITRRLFPEEARAALNRAMAAPTRLGGPPTDRFRRSVLAAPVQAKPQRGPAWLREASARKGVDLGLQIVELGFVLLFLYVIAQWLFADAQTDTNIAEEMAAVAVPTAAPDQAVSDNGGIELHPLLSSVAANGVLTVPAPPVDLPATDAWAPGQTRDSLLQDHFSSRAGTPLATLSQTTTTKPGAAKPPAAAPTPDPDAVESNPALPTEIRIPKIKLDARVKEVEVDLATWTWDVADYMAGHHSGTANPGETGNVVIAGHRDIRGSVFLHLDQLKKGDDIYVYSGRGIFHYVVRTVKIVLPSASEVMAPTTDQRLTLITCTPVKIASHRLIIIADLDTKYVAPDRGR